jgi:hypothetical protein
VYIVGDVAYIKSKEKYGKILDKIWTNYGYIYEVQVGDEVIEVEESNMEIAEGVFNI